MSDDHPQGPVQPHTAIRAVEPGTIEHDIWRHRQAMKQVAYEQRFAERGEHRPSFWGGTRAS
jgi:hypothetical protein